MKIYSLLLLLLTTFTALAQGPVVITVKDAQTGAGLPFATITSARQDYVSDVDGKLVLEHP